MMIRTVRIRGFKRFDEMEFRLPGHVVLAGPNNTGKTTVLQALASWSLALQRWRELNDFNQRNGYTRAPIARQAFTAVPLRSFDLLWTDRNYRGQIEIELDLSPGGSVGMELRADSTEQIYVRPKAAVPAETLRKLDLDAVFIPPMTGLSTEEPVFQPPMIEHLLGLGRPGEVLRNLLVEASRNEYAWNTLQESIRKLFGYMLLPPDASGAHIRTEYTTYDKGPTLDIASAGSGFQQVLMLLTFLNTRRGAVLLLDEPDAHLHTALAKVVYRWLAEDEAPVGIPPARLDALRNFNGDIRTIRVDSKVVRESDGGESKSDADRWMRLTLDTVGKTDWPRDRQGRPLYPEGFEALARKLERPLHPPGRDVRCIVSVGMLTEGWDCNTVTHIIGLRPFMSQLLCEQVVGRGLRRTSYAVGTDDRLSEEVAKIFGVPFEIIPLKENPQGSGPAPTPKTWRIRAVPEKAHLEIRFPRIEGYTQAIRHRVTVDWDSDDRSIVASSGLTAAVVAAAEVRTPSVARDPPNTARRGRTVVRSGGPISE